MSNAISSEPDAIEYCAIYWFFVPQNLNFHLEPPWRLVEVHDISGNRPSYALFDAFEFLNSAFPNLFPPYTKLIFQKLSSTQSIGQRAYSSTSADKCILPNPWAHCKRGPRIYEEVGSTTHFDTQLSAILSLPTCYWCTVLSIATCIWANFQNVAFSGDAGGAYLSAIPQRHGGFLSCVCTMTHARTRFCGAVARNQCRESCDACFGGTSCMVTCHAHDKEVIMHRIHDRDE